MKMESENLNFHGLSGVVNRRSHVGFRRLPGQGRCASAADGRTSAASRVGDANGQSLLRSRRRAVAQPPSPTISMLYHRTFDVIVVGGGHAGTEAALASARARRGDAAAHAEHRDAGADELQPGHRRGSARATSSRRSTRSAGRWRWAPTHCGIHFRTLNARKGPAVRATRAQIDRALYRRHIRGVLERTPAALAAPADGLRPHRGGGLGARGGDRDRSPHRGRVCGDDRGHLPRRAHARGAGESGGRGAPATRRRTRWRGSSPREREFAVGRLKTGTPPRIDGRTIDFSPARAAAR